MKLYFSFHKYPLYATTPPIPCAHSIYLFYYFSIGPKKNDTEFQKGFILLLKVNNGVVTNLHSAPDLYAGGLGLNPQVTVVEHYLRLGAIAGFVYTNKKFSGLISPFVPDDMKLMLAKGESSAADFVASLNPGEVDWA